LPAAQADGAYGNRPSRARAQAAGFRLQAPSRGQRRPGVGRIRQAVERCHNFFAQFGRIGRRLDRSAKRFLGWIQLAALGSNHCKPPFRIRRDGKGDADLLLLGHQAAFCIIRISSRRKGAAMIPNRTAGTSPVVQCGRTKLCCNRCTSKVRCRASVFLA